MMTANARRTCTSTFISLAAQPNHRKDCTPHAASYSRLAPVVLNVWIICISITITTVCRHSFVFFIFVSFSSIGIWDLLIVNSAFFIFNCAFCYFTFLSFFHHCKALNSLICADVPLRNYSLTHLLDVTFPLFPFLDWVYVEGFHMSTIPWILFWTCYPSCSIFSQWLHGQMPVFHSWSVHILVASFRFSLWLVELFFRSRSNCWNRICCCWSTVSTVHTGW